MSSMSRRSSTQQLAPTPQVTSDEYNHYENCPTLSGADVQGSTTPTLDSMESLEEGSTRSATTFGRKSEPLLMEGEVPNALERRSKYEGEENEYFHGGGVREEGNMRGFDPNLDKSKTSREDRGSTHGLGHTRDADGFVVESHRTLMMDPQMQSNHELGSKDGKLQGADGRDLDTSNAQKTSLRGTQQGVYIYSLDTQDKLRAVDSNGLENEVNDQNDPNNKQHVHHSSLTRGKAVRGAGGIKAKEGHVQDVTTGSGHYLPQEENLLHTLDHLDGMGVGLGTANATVWRNGGTTERHNANAYQKTRGDKGAMDARSNMLGAINGLGTDGTNAQRLDNAKNTRSSPTSSLASPTQLTDDNNHYESTPGTVPG